MIYSINTEQKIDWNAKGHKKILQNVSNILNTFMYEVAYDRVMGRDPSNLDKPLDKLIPNIVAETYDLIEEYEPRVDILDVQVIIQDGNPIIKVVVDI